MNIDYCDSCGMMHRGDCPTDDWKVRAEKAEARVAELEEALREDVGGVVRTNLAQRKRIQELEAERSDVEAVAKEMAKSRARIAELEGDNARLREALGVCGRAGCPTATERSTGR